MKLDKFYNSPSWEQPHKLEAKIEGYSDTFSIDLVHNDQTPDCVLGHFGYNFYIRSPYGIKAKKYKSFKTLVCSLVKVAKNNGLRIQSIGLKKEWKYRSIITI